MIGGGGLQDLGSTIEKFGGLANLVLGLHLFKKISPSFTSDRFLGERSHCLLRVAYVARCLRNRAGRNLRVRLFTKMNWQANMFSHSYFRIEKDEISFISHIFKLH